MILNLVGFAMVFGIVGAIGWVTRSFFAAILASLALSILVLASVTVQLGSDVGSILDYAAEPKEPILLVVTDGPQPVSAMWIKPKEIRETRLLMSQMRSGDPTVAGRAREVLKKRFAADVPEGHRGLPPPAIIHSMISSSIQALDATAFGRMVAHVEHGGWTEAAKGSFRLIKVDVSGPRALLHGRATLPIQVPVATGTADGQFRVPFVLDCIAAPDCRDRILAAVRDPNQALAKLGEMTDVSKFVADNPDVAADLETQAEFIPPGSYANFIATGIAFAMAGRLALETGGSSVQTLLAAQPVEIFPKTPTARLVDRVFALASHGPLARLAQERFGDAIHKLTRSLAGS